MPTPSFWSIAGGRSEVDSRAGGGRGECVAFPVCASLGLDTSGFSIPYMAGWGKEDEVGRYCELIDRLARRIEDALLEVEPPKDDRGDGAAAPVLATA